MRLEISNRGFEYVTHPAYGNNVSTRLMSQSSAVGDHEDAYDKPGSSFLWVGNDHHLSREEVRELINRLESWLASNTLELPGDEIVDFRESEKEES